MDQAMKAASTPIVDIVEDDEAVRDSFAAVLDASGMEARGFGSAEEYLAAPDRRLGGCLLLDLNLPGMGGLEMLEQLRAKGDRLPAIIITARRTPPVDERARSGGAIGRAHV